VAAEAEMQSQFFDRARAVLAAVMRDGTVAAVCREGIKDVRNTVHETYFGRGENAGEPGAPLNPTQGEIAAARKEDPQLYGPKQEANQAQPSPSDIAKDQGGVHGPKQEANQPLPSPSEIGKDKGGVHGPQQKEGQELRPEAAHGGKEQPSPSPADIAHDKGKGGEQGQDQTPPAGFNSWEEYLQDREKQKLSGQGDQDGYQKAEGRSKADEELEKRREGERDRGGREGR
jgi:hypothetical protein